MKHEPQQVTIVAKKYGAWWRFKTAFKWSFLIFWALAVAWITYNNM